MQNFELSHGIWPFLQNFYRMRNSVLGGDKVTNAAYLCRVMVAIENDRHSSCDGRNIENIDLI